MSQKTTEEEERRRRNRKEEEKIERKKSEEERKEREAKNDPNGKEPPCDAWQTTAMENQINHLTDPLDSPGPKQQYPVVKHTHELSTDEQARLASQFFPDIKITGVELRIEKKRSWGGLYYRVLKKEKKPTEKSAEEKACIQWLYVWTKQKFFFSFGETLLPSFILGVLGLIFFNNFYGEQEVLTGKIGMTIVSGFCIALGGKRLYDGLNQMLERKEKHFYFQNSMLLLPMGLGFMYYVIFNPSIWRRGTSGFLYSILKRIVIWRLIDTETKELLIPCISVIFFGVGLGLLLFWLVQPKMHEMDWAPLFIYLKKKKPDKREWELDKVIFDAYHYYTNGFISKECLTNNGYLKGKTETSISFEIPNFWHSFNLFGERRRTQYNNIARFISYLAGGFTFVFYLISYFTDDHISVRLAVLLLGLLAGGFTFVFYNISYFIEDHISVRLAVLLLGLLAGGFTFVVYFNNVNAVSIRLTVLLLWLFGGIRVYSKTTRNFIGTKPKETTGDEKEVCVLVEGVDDPVSLDKCIFHLTEDRIKTFWALKGDAALVIKSKLQNPFISDFDTFRDEEEEDLFMKRFLRFLHLLFRRGE